MKMAQIKEMDYQAAEWKRLGVVEFPNERLETRKKERV